MGELMNDTRLINTSHLKRNIDDNKLANQLMLRLSNHIESELIDTITKYPKMTRTFYARIAMKHVGLAQALEYIIRTENDKGVRNSSIYKSMLEDTVIDFNTYGMDIPDTTDAWRDNVVHANNEAYKTGAKQKRFQENVRVIRKLRQNEFVKKFNKDMSW
jgi:hypothetical protein